MKMPIIAQVSCIAYNGREKCRKVVLKLSYAWCLFPNRQCERKIRTSAAWRIGQRRSAHERSYGASGPVSAGMDDRLQAGIPTSVCNKPTRSTQPCIAPGSLNRVPASALVRTGMSHLPGDPTWHVSSRSGEASCQLLYSISLYIYAYFLTTIKL